MPRKKTSRFSRKWRVIVSLLCAVIVIGALFWLLSGHDKQTRATMFVSAPVPTMFTDDNYADFTTDSDTPDINNNRTLNDVQPLRISYNWESGPYAPTFKQQLTDSDIAKHVKITPYIRGTWTLETANAIRFIPESDWSPNTHFTVKLSPKLFNDDIQPDKRIATFTTPKMVAKIESFNIYPDRSHKQHVVATAVVSFNYPIDTNGFDKRVTIKRGLHRIPFSVRFDRFNRTAIITTEPIAVEDNSYTLRIKINRIPSMTTDASTNKINASATVDATDNFFKIIKVQSIAADDSHGNPQQLILLNMTTAAQNNTDWLRMIDVYLLPKHNNDDEDSDFHQWATDEVSDKILEKSKKLTLIPTDFANPIGVYQYAFAYNVADTTPRYLYIRIHSGIESNSGFILKNGIERVLPVAYPEKTVKIAGSGALLSLAGDKKLGIMARGGVDTAYVNLYKVKSSEINHLITQTYNVFASNLDFKSWSFNAYDMASVFKKRIPFMDTAMNKTNYASLDLGDYLDRRTVDKTGIFIIQIGTSESDVDFSDRRLILLTNLGIIRKVAVDETSSVFVSNINDGTPAADIKISVLGRNGNAIWAGQTDTTGFVALPRFAWSEYKNEREPVAIVATDDNDVSFIPFNSYDTHVEYSKFDIDGSHFFNDIPLNAFLFSDRGIYRPGEAVVIGGLVKNTSFSKLAETPLKLEVTDARGRTIQEKTFVPTSDGMFDFTFSVSDTAAIGEYVVNLYLTSAKNRIINTIGTTTFRVQEFTPDNLKIGATINGATENGWISPTNMVANITLNNLFGMPATNRRIVAHATLRPTDFTFPEYREYIFTPNFINGNGFSSSAANRTRTFSVDLPNTTTDESGNAILDIDFNSNIPHGTYVMTLKISGFEGASGPSVQTTLSTRVSNAPYLIGYHADSNLNFISRDDIRTVKLIALDANGTRTSANKLKLSIMRRENLTSLIKDYNDYYKYQTITRDIPISTTDMDILASGTDIRLDTKRGGTYFVQITDENDNILAHIDYFVADTSNVSLQSDTNAEMQIKLNKSEYAAGDDITINVITPYTGTGLITIERDRVYAYKWFQTQTTSSVQHIALPEGFEGSGYVNVSFVRDINSRDIFTTPYTFAVAPFRADTTKRNIRVELDTPTNITDNKLSITYKTDKNAHMMIFAINMGILQVAKYAIPNPLEHFFPKSALQVDTYQILSLLLPEYKILREFAKTGGSDFVDAEGGIGVALTNPFSRKTNKPVAFYSGIISTTANTTNTLTFDIPEYFNGAVRVFAVAANDSAVGSAYSDTTVQSPIIVSTTSPLVVAPNDVFDINTIITNLTDGTTATAKADVNASVSPNLTITTNSANSLDLPYGTEKLWSFVVRAGNELGNGDIQIDTSIRDGSNDILSQRQTHSSLLIRPTTLFETRNKFGLLKPTTNIRDFSFDMYPEYSSTRLYISKDITIVARPLVEYLRKYEYPCTEQLVSRALPFALAPSSAILDTEYIESKSIIETTISALKNRQNDDGSFGLWSGDENNGDRSNESNAVTAYLTAYVTQFLKIAQKSGFSVPKNMISRAIDYMRTFAGTQINNDLDASAHAFVIYILTHNNYITTGYIDAFEEYANANIKNWQADLMGTYIAASYKILKQESKASNLISKYRPSYRLKYEPNIFRNPVADNAMHAHIMGLVFGDKPTNLDNSVTEYINDGNYDSFTSAAIVLAMAGDTNATIPETVTVTADGVVQSITTHDGIIVADIPLGSKTITVRCEECDNKIRPYYTIVSGGFPRNTTTYSNGIEISREYFDNTGNRITKATVGDVITVKIHVRSRRNDNIPNVVITDLVPGGFIPGEVSGDNISYSETREDRVLVFLDVSREAQTITYNAQIGAAGAFQIPAVHAQSMYNPQLNANGDPGETFTVTNVFAQ